MSSSIQSSFKLEERQFKETLHLFSPDHQGGKYLAVKQSSLCKIGFLQLVWEKIKGVFLGKDATNADLIKLTALEWMAKGIKCESTEDYPLIEALARQAGLIPNFLKNGPKNVQELTQEIGKKLFPAGDKREETGDHSPNNEQTAQEETANLANLLNKFIIQHEKQLNRFPSK